MALLRLTGDPAGPQTRGGIRAPALEIERQVAEAVRVASPASNWRGRHELHQPKARGHGASTDSPAVRPSDYNATLRAAIERVVMSRTTIEIELAEGIASDDQNRILIIPWTPPAPHRRREIIQGEGERERARNNLARYFSPNIVELLAAQDEPLGAVRGETIAVLFADIVGFTQMAETMPPEAVMAMLREFHARVTAKSSRAAAPSTNTLAMRSSAFRARAPRTPPMRWPAPERCSMRSRVGMTIASARQRAGSRWASASTTGRRLSAMSAASTACRSR
jgi:Adenylate and Guanylate cyclase catalytic domain